MPESGIYFSIFSLPESAVIMRPPLLTQTEFMDSDDMRMFANILQGDWEKNRWHSQDYACL